MWPKNVTSFCRGHGAVGSEVLLGGGCAWDPEGVTRRVSGRDAEEDGPLRLGGPG